MWRQLTLLSLCLAGVAAAQNFQVPGVVIDHQPASTREYIGSPSIVIAKNGDYVASHDLFGPGSAYRESAETKVFVSKDRGENWKQVADLHDQFWSNLFRQQSRLYLMGTSKEYGRIVIRSSDDNGRSWSEAHPLTGDSGYHTAPVPVVVHQGRIYRAFEYHPAGPWGSFQAFMMSASEHADLTLESSWTRSNRLPFPANASGNTWLEGNAVIAPNGSVVDVLRVDNLERAAILELHSNVLEFSQFVDFPGGAKKFTIRFDPRSKLYWSLVNPALPGEAASVFAPASVRNTLAVVSSPDLVHWTPRTVLLHHPDTLKHGFQYVDWQFDHSDMIAVIRMAFEDAEGGAHSFHDANYLTFYRVRNFRDLGKTTLRTEPMMVAETYSPVQIEKWVEATRAKAAAGKGAAGQPIGSYGTHSTALTTRMKTGAAEQHRDWCDLFFVLSGQATLVSGGHLEGAHSIADGEMQGSGITGGTEAHLSPGSMVHIGADVPHQLILPPGETFSYIAVKLPPASRP